MLWGRGGGGCIQGERQPCRNSPTDGRLPHWTLACPFGRPGCCCGRHPSLSQLTSPLPPPLQAWVIDDAVRGMGGEEERAAMQEMAELSGLRLLDAEKVISSCAKGKL